MKKLAIIFIPVLVACLCIFLAIMFWQGVRNAPGNNIDVMSIAKKKISDIFWINGKLYYINGEGKLYIRKKESDRLYVHSDESGQYYIRSNNSDKLVYTFPTSYIQWSDEFKVFLYYNAEAIYSYNPLEKRGKMLFDRKGKFEPLLRMYIFATANQYALLRLDTVSYKINLEVAEIILLPEFIYNSIANTNDMIVYTTYPENDVMYFDHVTNEEYKLNNEYFYSNSQASLDIRSSCIVDNILYFTKSDGKIYGVQINSGEVKTIEVFPKGADILKKHVIAIEWTGKSLLCVTLDYNTDNGIKKLSVCEVASDGTFNVVRKDDETYYDMLTGSCKIRVQGDKYAYLIDTDDLVVFGNLNQ